MKNTHATHSSVQILPIRRNDGRVAVTSTPCKTDCYIREGNQTCLIYTSIGPPPFTAYKTSFYTRRRPRGRAAMGCTRLPIVADDTRIQPNSRTDHYSRCWSSGSGAA